MGWQILRNRGSPHLLYSLHFPYKFSPLIHLCLQIQTFVHRWRTNIWALTQCHCKAESWRYFECTKCQKARSQLLCCLRRRSVPARLLGLWVQIPPRAWTFVSSECCQVEVSVTDWSLVQTSPTECGASVCATLCATHQQVQLPDSEQAK